MHDIVEPLRGHVGAGAPERHLRWITATVDEIVFFQSDHKYPRVVLADVEFLIKKTLKVLLAELDPDQLRQTHRSTVVNALAVTAMEPDFSGRLTMRLRGRREHPPVSEGFAAKYRRM